MATTTNNYLDLTGLGHYDSKIKEVLQKDIASAWASSTAYTTSSYVVYNGLLYKCSTAHTSTSTFDSTKWTQVKLVENIITPVKTTADAAIPKSTVTTKGDVLVASGNASLSRLGVGSNGQVLTADSSATNGVKWATPASISNATITIQKNGTTVNTFTLNGSATTVNITDVASASSLSTVEGKIPTAATSSNQLADKSWVTTQVRTNASHYRGSWATWSAVPTTAASYPVDVDGSHTPTANDYMIVEDASGYSSSNTGTWRFIYVGVWSEDGTTAKNNWQPAYKIENAPITYKTINSESIIGSGNIITPNYYNTSVGTTGLKVATGYVNGTANTSYDIYVPNANGTTSAGVVSTGAQTFGGVKTFSSAPQLSSGVKFAQKTVSSTTYYATVQGNADTSSNITLTLPSSTGTLALFTDIPVVTYNADEVTGASKIKSITVGSTSYNLGTSNATSSANGTIKLFSDTQQSVAANAVSSTASRTYGLQVNSNGQGVINVPWTDTTYTVGDGLLDGNINANSSNKITFEPYSTQQSKLSFDTSSTAPSRTDRLNLNGYLYATKLYSANSEVITASSIPVTDVQLNGTTIVSNKIANIPITLSQSTSGSGDSASTSTSWGYKETTIEFVSITNNQINGLFTTSS